MKSDINPFDSQEAKPYKNDPDILAMTNLVRYTDIFSKPNFEKRESNMTCWHFVILQLLSNEQWTIDAFVKLRSLFGIFFRIMNTNQFILSNLIHSAYQNNDISAFESIVAKNRASIMQDPFIREHIEDLLRNVRTQVLCKLIKPYTKIRIPFISQVSF